MKNLIVLLLLIGNFAAFAEDGLNSNNFPRVPNLTETPGKLCSSPDAYRYAEKIAYCNRNVDPYMKEDVINKYDKNLGFHIKSMARSDFKIDHLIPLCAGGANDEDNLWPQHKTIYKITDPVEPLICDKMAKGKLTQAEAVQKIIYAKTHLNEVPQIISELNKL